MRIWHGKHSSAWWGLARVSGSGGHVGPDSHRVVYSPASSYLPTPSSRRFSPASQLGRPRFLPLLVFFRSHFFRFCITLAAQMHLRLSPSSSLFSTTAPSSSFHSAISPILCSWGQGHCYNPSRGYNPTWIYPKIPFYCLLSHSTTNNLPFISNCSTLHFS